jgi:xanthine dehydrogenase small subunit
VLVGSLEDDEVIYRSVTSCLMPVANANGRHVVTIEGINSQQLNPVQQAMSDEAATQCGFCTPGFVMSLTGYCLQDKNENVIASMDGNICRCTGYKSIERAANKLAQLVSGRAGQDPVAFSVEKKIVPAYFNDIKSRLQSVAYDAHANGNAVNEQRKYFVGGGTDLYVQRHEEMVHAQSKYLLSENHLRGIAVEGSECIIGASTTVSDMMESPEIRKLFNRFGHFSSLVSSTPIRNMATLGGNLVNASPIGDFTVFFLALNARVVLNDDTNSRELFLRDFYKGYKQLDKKPDEYIRQIRFFVPDQFRFNFEKVSKRTNLDIASVNSAIFITGTELQSVSVSAGGVGPVPMYLEKTSRFLSAHAIDERSVREACRIAGEEISPISDVRGSADYKRLLLQKLICAHFISLFPSEIKPEKLLSGEEY